MTRSVKLQNGKLIYEVCGHKFYNFDVVTLAAVEIDNHTERVHGLLLELSLDDVPGLGQWDRKFLAVRHPVLLVNAKSVARELNRFFKHDVGLTVVTADRTALTIRDDRIALACLAVPTIDAYTPALTNLRTLWNDMKQVADEFLRDIATAGTLKQRYALRHEYEIEVFLASTEPWKKIVVNYVEPELLLSRLDHLDTVVLLPKLVFSEMGSLLHTLGRTSKVTVKSIGGDADEHSESTGAACA